jgi:hypothetical protein
MLCEFHNTDEPYGITVLEREHLAWIRGSQWDIIESCDTSRVKRLKALAESEDRFILVPVDEHMTREEHNAREFWREYVPREERARLKIRSLVPYDRIIEIDPMGDAYNPVPHVFVDWHPEYGPFDPDSWHCFSDENDTHILQTGATAESRVSLFPTPIPDSLYPPPAGFDPLSTPRALSSLAAARLDEILASAKRTPSGPAEVVALGRTPFTPSAFIRWRDDIAMPVFSTFVERIRAHGHDARISLFSAPADTNGHGWKERIGLEIRIQDHSSLTPYAAGRKRTAYIRYTASADTPFEICSDPLPRGSRSGHSNIQRSSRLGNEGIANISDFDAARIEQDILTVLEQL